jgi:hypothetical protein
MRASVLTDTRRQREWLQQWRRAAVALEEVRAAELAHLRPADALAATETLLALGASLPIPASRLMWSGLIDFQRRLHDKR